MKAQPYETLKRQREEETLGIHGNEPRSNREDRAELLLRQTTLDFLYDDEELAKNLHFNAELQFGVR